MKNTDHLPIAVFGATGAQGGPVVRALLDAGRPVRVIVRDQSKAQPLAERGAEVAVAELTDADALTAALSSVSGAFAHLPFVPVMEFIRPATQALSKALVAAQVPLTVFSTSGSVPSKPTGVASFDTKAEAKRILLASGAPLIVFEPAGYLANLSAPFVAPPIVKAGELRYPLPAAHRQPWVSVEDQARLAVLALGRPDLAGRTFGIGAQLTGSDLAAGLSQGLGRPVTYAPVSPATFAATVTPMLGADIAAALDHDYSLLGARGSGLDLDLDTTILTAELNTAYTSVGQWAKTQPWEAMAEAGTFLFPDLVRA
jgi:uncharacterized protein YbjT (DUF2867 family)